MIESIKEKRKTLDNETKEIQMRQTHSLLDQEYLRTKAKRS